MKKNNFMPTIVLGCICLVSALLLSCINQFTAPLLAQKEQAQSSGALLEVLPEGTTFDEVTLADYPTLPSAVAAAWRAPEGCVFKTVTKGYANGLTLMIGIDNDGKIVNTKVVSSNETYGFEGKLDGAYNDKTLDSVDLIIASGATAKSETSKGYYDGVLAALQAFGMLGGAEVDTRTPEEILQDNCKEALGTDQRNFIQWYASSKALGDAKIYMNDKGVVVSSGEYFVGYLFGSDAPYGTPSAEALAATAAAYEIYASATRVTLSDYQGIGKAVNYAYKLADGSYLLRLERKGFEWAAKPMVIELVIDKDGKIASCVTISHSESGGYGDYCGDPEYYNQYVGKDKTDYNTVPGIVGNVGSATQTSTGYKDAIRQGFAAFEKFIATEGDNA